MSQCAAFVSISQRLTNTIYISHTHTHSLTESLKPRKHIMMKMMNSQIARENGKRFYWRFRIELAVITNTCLENSNQSNTFFSNSSLYNYLRRQQTVTLIIYILRYSRYFVDKAILCFFGLFILLSLSFSYLSFRISSCYSATTTFRVSMAQSRVFIFFSHIFIRKMKKTLRFLSTKRVDPTTDSREWVWRGEKGSF